MKRACAVIPEADVLLQPDFALDGNPVFLGASFVETRCIPPAGGARRDVLRATWSRRQESGLGLSECSLR